MKQYESLLKIYAARKGGCSPCIRNMERKIRQAEIKGMSEDKIIEMIKRNING